ncbi:hypothetical protein LOK49_LG13G02273 [Camellia lanceoleosa]|uniref:Uncharacterized protein n=1 Tax=Camellia lanceoleosa TaxID=1840588 RepID=A0ACC0FME9_9ERIC|nr:hypothetical protein LOK49_LG13G02273 [Camellia lanceoleosa]
MMKALLCPPNVASFCFYYPFVCIYIYRERESEIMGEGFEGAHLSELSHEEGLPDSLSLYGELLPLLFHSLSDSLSLSMKLGFRNQHSQEVLIERRFVLGFCWKENSYESDTQTTLSQPGFSINKRDTKCTILFRPLVAVSGWSVLGLKLSTRLY